MSQNTNVLLEQFLLKMHVGYFSYNWKIKGHFKNNIKEKFKRKVKTSKFPKIYNLDKIFRLI